MDQECRVNCYFLNVIIISVAIGLYFVRKTSGGNFYKLLVNKIDCRSWKTLESLQFRFFRASVYAPVDFVNFFLLKNVQSSVFTTNEIYLIIINIVLVCEFGPVISFLVIFGVYFLPKTSIGNVFRVP